MFICPQGYQGYAIKERFESEIAEVAQNEFILRYRENKNTLDRISWHESMVCKTLF
jgi:endo-beta-N-acetylglucosaminidase D